MFLNIVDYATCSPLEYRCGNGQCIKENQRCNGVFDCADRTDETHCGRYLFITIT